MGHCRRLRRPNRHPLPLRSSILDLDLVLLVFILVLIFDPSLFFLLSNSSSSSSSAPVSYFLSPPPGPRFCSAFAPDKCSKIRKQKDPHRDYSLGPRLSPPQPSHQLPRPVLHHLRLLLLRHMGRAAPSAVFPRVSRLLSSALPVAAQAPQARAH
eukprot:750890-Hanusia_phi.AAC.3